MSSPKHLFYGDATGWHINDAGRALLACVEKPAPMMATTDQDPDVVVTVTPVHLKIRNSHPKANQFRAAEKLVR